MKKKPIEDVASRKEREKQEALRHEMLRNKVLNSISVIVQGKIFGLPGDPYEKQLTIQCIGSIKNFLPKAEIIISTWEGSITSHLPADVKIIFNKDPGAVSYSDVTPGFLNNNNRQIVSAYNGLKQATATYAVKMRGDSKLVDTDFINYFREYPRGDQLNFFKQRIIIPTKYTRNPRRIAQLIHPSDIFQAGLLEDLLSLWDIPLQPEPQTTRAFPLEKRILNNALVGGIHRMKFGAEQYNWYSFCKKHGLDFELKHYSHIPFSKIVASDISIVNNFVIEDALKLGVLIPKKMNAHFDADLYTHEEWLRYSKRYAEGAGRFSEISLIAQVYHSNVSKIIDRAWHKLMKYGVSDFFYSLRNYLHIGKPTFRTPDPNI
jgi:hypothetical protein